MAQVELHVYWTKHPWEDAPTPLIMQYECKKPPLWLLKQGVAVVEIPLVPPSLEEFETQAEAERRKKAEEERESKQMEVQSLETRLARLREEML